MNDLPPSEDRPPQKKEILGIFLGLLLLIGMHAVAFTIGMIIISNMNFYEGTALSFMIFGLMGFFLIQLIYVLPVIWWLREQGYKGVMKGVIIGAVITALINGPCSIYMLFSLGL